MVRGVEGNEMSTPRSSQKKQPPSGSQSAKNQKSILGFFQKKATNSPSPGPSDPTSVKKALVSSQSKPTFSRPRAAITPVPSSDAPVPSSPIKQEQDFTQGKNKENGLLSSVTGSDVAANRDPSEVAGVAVSSPSRKVHRAPCIVVECAD
jgi:DNA mismatch repair protein MSH6